jgi:putative tricarboxylic transport membrane protein
MSMERAQAPQRGPHWLRLLTRQDVLSGLMFIAIAVLGLWMSRDYSIGNAFRMGTGYVPRLLCWILLALGAVIVLQGLRSQVVLTREPGFIFRPIVLIPAALLAFGLSFERLGLIVSGALLIVIGSLAGRDMRALEVVATGAALIAVSWAIFVWGLGLPMPVWPER